MALAAVDGAGFEPTGRRLLQTVVEVTQRVFGAAAASIFTVDRETGELVFESVSGEGKGHLRGARFPAGTGIAGWVAACGQPMLADDVDEVGQFATDAAASTGYVPRSIMAAPIIHDGECIGVLEVLDRGSQPRRDLQDVDLLAVVAAQAALGLEILSRLHWTSGSRIEPTGSWEAMNVMLWRIGSRLPIAQPEIADNVVALLKVADELLARAGTSI